MCHGPLTPGTGPSTLGSADGPQTGVARLCRALPQEATHTTKRPTVLSVNAALSGQLM